MIDWERVKELRAEIGAESFAEVLDLFLEEVEEVVVRLGDRPSNLLENLHFLKGSALNLGFRDFGILCQEGERRCTAGAADSVDITRILGCYQGSKEIFMARVPEFLDAA